jgi:molybdate transport system substrate-binding protein
MFRAFVLVLLCSTGGLLAADVNVYAAASLTDALKEVGASYGKQSGDAVRFNFAASSTLARQIEEGAPADIFFSADHAQMDRLERGGHIETASRRDLLGNTLVVIAPAETALNLSSVEDLRQVNRIAVGDPKLVPVGAYARAYLERAGLWQELQPKIIPTENVRAGLAVVASSNADAGFVYATDAAVSKNVKIVLRVAPEEGPPIRYPAALVKRGGREARAEKLLAYLSSEDARTVFRRFGFLLPP